MRPRTDPFLQLLVKSPAKQYWRRDFVNHVQLISFAHRLSQALVPCVTTRAMVVTVHSMSGRPILAKHKHVELTVTLSCRFALCIFTVAQQDWPHPEPDLVAHDPDATFGTESRPQRGFTPTSMGGRASLSPSFCCRGFSLNDPGSSIVRAAHRCSSVRSLGPETLTPAHVRRRPSDSATCAFVAHAERLLSFLQT